MTTPRGRARLRSTWAFGLGILAALPLASPLRARPVVIGREVELAYGISTSHPCPMPGVNARRANASRFRAPAEAPRRLFTVRVGRGRTQPPVVTADGSLFVVSATGLAGLEPMGRRRFARQLGLVPEGPSIDPMGRVVVGVILRGEPGRRGERPRGRVGVPGSRGALLVLDTAGEVVALTRLPLSPWSSPLVLDDGSVVVPGADGVVRRVHPEGPLVFELPLGEVARTSTAELPSGALVLGVGGRLVFFAPEGRVSTELALGDAIVAGPAVDPRGLVWALTSRGVLFGATPTGGVQARIELGSPTPHRSSLAVGRDGAVWLGTSDGALRCFEPTGALRFRAAPGGPVVGVTLDATGAAVVLEERGGLSLVAPSGEPRWRIETGARTQAAPVIAADGTLYVATLAGAVQAWR